MHFVLHIGPDKTGTSAVQQWFSNHRDALADNGILYSRNGCGEDGAFNALVAGLMGHPSSGHPQDGIRKLAAFRQDLADFRGDTVLLSAEDFSYRILKKDNGISPRFGPKRVAIEAASLIGALRRLGARRIIALVVLRNEGDRAVSRVVQTIQDLRLPQLTPHELPPDPDLLIHSHHFCSRALTDLHVEVVPVLYADPGDDRPLAARLLHTAGLAPDLSESPPPDERVNRSMGLSGCVAAMQIKDVILKNRTEKPGKVKVGLGSGHFCLQKVYRNAGGPDADTPFNGVGPARVAKVIDAQTRINRVFKDRLGSAALDGLGQTKWHDVPLSPLRAGQMAPDQRTRTACILDNFALKARKLPKAEAIFGARCLDTFDALSEAFISDAQP